MRWKPKKRAGFGGGKEQSLSQTPQLWRAADQESTACGETQTTVRWRGGARPLQKWAARRLGEFNQNRGGLAVSEVGRIGIAGGAGVLAEARGGRFPPVGPRA